MPLTEEEAAKIGLDEEDRWVRVHGAIFREIRRTNADYDQDRRVARDLTSQIVATRREEDRLQLLSDERVAHGLTKLRKEKSTGLDSLLEQPYFARVVTREEGREIEFRLGTASFPAERIIDWRKAPISKLYYDYKEGDEFSEVIQERDREGVIVLRRAFKGVEEDLYRVETSQGVIAKTPEGWRPTGKGEKFSRTEDHDGHLPPILSLITSDQFELITKDARKPIIIQGIAGSGKTTVALHRLAWLLHEDNSDAQPEKCLVVMFNRSLKAYVETTLPELKINRVPIRTFSQWANQLLNDLIGPRPRGPINKGRELELFKSSSLILKLLHDYVLKNPTQGQFVDDLFGFYQGLLKQEIIWRKWDQVRGEIREQISKRVCDFQDDALLLHLIYAEHGYYPTKLPASLGLCDHIVIDEAQDFGIVEIKALLNAVDRDRTVTIVGDVAQKIVAGRNFGSWEELLKEAGFEDTTPLSLTVSYRTTDEIMGLAKKIRGGLLFPTEGQGAGRSGPDPTLIRIDTPKVLAHRVGQWIDERLAENSRCLSAIICRWPKLAQELVEELRKIGYPSVRLGHREQFDFSPGIIVTNVHQVKGLEFRNVLVVEPSEENYKSTNEEERNLLYVAVTRAEQRLDFMGHGRPTALLPRLPS